jgi:hypothetical protein
VYSVVNWLLYRFPRAVPRDESLVEQMLAERDQSVGKWVDPVDGLPWNYAIVWYVRVMLRSNGLMLDGVSTSGCWLSVAQRHAIRTYGSGYGGRIGLRPVTLRSVFRPNGYAKL